MKTIIILGGGVGGIVTANELSSHLNGEHKIILIEKKSDHTFAPSYLWLMNGDRKKNQIKVPLKSLLKNNMEVVNATVDGIHLQAEVVAKNIIKTIKGEKGGDKFSANGYCMLEAGEELAGFAYGDFFGEPNPQVKLKMIGKKWHIGKVLFEKWWLSPVGLKKDIYKNLLLAGGKLVGIPIKL